MAKTTTVVPVNNIGGTYADALDITPDGKGLTKVALRVAWFLLCTALIIWGLWGYFVADGGWSAFTALVGLVAFMFMGGLPKVARNTVA